MLVIEPDLTVQAAYRSALEEAGYRVLTAPDGAQGMAIALEERPSVIIGDFPIQLPGEALFTVMVRRDERLSDVFILNITDRLLTEKDSVAWMLSDRVLAKPIDGARLVDEVGRAVERKGVLD